VHEVIGELVVNPESGDLMAEGYDLLRRGLGFDVERVKPLFSK